MPLYVKAGSIVPLCKEDVQCAAVSDWKKLTLAVYPGANAEFTLYEDEGDNYNYEKGVYSTITFKWNDKAGKLTVGAAQGEFPGMLKNRKFNVRIVGKDGVRTVDYNGQEVTL